MRRHQRDDRGAGFIEYGILLALIAAVALLAVQNFGNNTNDTFQRAGTEVIAP